MTTDRHSTAMRRRMFRYANMGMVAALICAALASDPFGGWPTYVAYALTGALITAFVVFVIFDHRAFEYFSGHLNAVYGLVLMLCLLRQFFVAPNGVYVPMVVFAFFVLALGTWRLVIGTTAIYALSGLTVIYTTVVLGMTIEGLEKFVIAYAVSPAAAMLLIGYIGDRFSKSVDEVEAIVRATSKLPTDKNLSRGHSPTAVLGNGDRASVLADRMGITASQANVVGMLIDGATNEHIAQRLEISSRTVQSHIRGAMSRTELASRTQLAVVAALLLREAQ